MGKKDKAMKNIIKNNISMAKATGNATNPLGQTLAALSTMSAQAGGQTPNTLPPGMAFNPLTLGTTMLPGIFNLPGMPGMQGQAPLKIKEDEIEIIKAIKGQNTVDIINKLTAYDGTERHLFWKQYNIDGDKALNYMKEHLKTNFKPLIAGELFGNSYFDALLLKTTMETNSSSAVMTIICIMKFVKRVFVDDAFTDCFGLSFKNFLQNWDNEYADKCYKIYITPRRKNETYNYDTIMADIENLFRRIENKETASIMQMFVTYSKSRVRDIANAYYFTYGYAVYEHAEKRALEKSCVEFLRNLIPVAIEQNYYFAYVLSQAFLTKDYDIMVPYLVKALKFAEKNKVTAAYRKLTGKSLSAEIEERFPPAISAFLCARAE